MTLDPPSTTPNNTLRYRADVDGLRAVAVLAVLFYHAEISFRGISMAGGYVGVDVFFVISGYLITGIILKDLARGRFDIFEFWERRARRILPALVVVVAACLVAGWRLFMPEDFKALGQSAVAQVLFAANFYFWRDAGYFAQVSLTKPLLHTWSLAVEEQFYLFFPWVLLAIDRFARRHLIAVLAVLWCVSFYVCIRWSYHNAQANFFMLPTRAWELLTGALLVAMPPRRAGALWLNELLGWGGMAAIVYATFAFDRHTRFPGVAALLPCGGAGLLIWANGAGPTSVGRLLAARPVVFVGLISYSLYLWHWPVLVFFQYSALESVAQWQRGGLLLASVALAICSWRWVETPFRKRRVAKTRKGVFAAAGVACAALLCAALGIVAAQGVPQRFPVQALRYLEGKSNRLFLNEISLKDARQENFVELGAGDKRLPIELFVWGDSFAMAAMPMLDLLTKEQERRVVAATHSASPPLLGYVDRDRDNPNDRSVAYKDAVAAAIRKHHVRRVLLIAYWQNYLQDPQDRDRFRDGLNATLDALTTTGMRIWIMKDVPIQAAEVPKALALRHMRGKPLAEAGCTREEYAAQLRTQDAIFAAAAARYPAVTLLEPGTVLFDSNGRCRVAEDGHALYRDRAHLTTPGAMLLRPMFEPVFATLGDGREAALRQID